jgi:hypothetical protein
MLVSMMIRDEALERIDAAGYAYGLTELLKKGQDLDAELDGGAMVGTLRGFLGSLKVEVDKALSG